MTVMRVVQAIRRRGAGRAAIATEATFPPLPLFASLAQAPAVVRRGKASFLAAPEPLPADRRAWRHFQVEDLYFRLLPGQPLADVQAQYLTTAARDAVGAHKMRYLQRAIDQRLETQEKLQYLLAQQHVLLFLIRRLIPKLRQLERNETVPPETDLPKEYGTAEQTAVPAMTRLLSRPGAPIDLTVLERSFGQDAVVLNGMVYPLVPASAERGADLTVWMDGACAALAVPGRSLDTVADAFLTRLQQAIEAQALAEAPELVEIRAAIAAAEADAAVYLRQAVTAVGDDGLYRGDRYAVLRRQETWTVCIDVPPYIVEDGDGTLYRFGGTQVGLPVVSCDPADVLRAGRARVLTPYAHMFVSNELTRASICMSKADAYYQALWKRPLEEAILTYLEDARYTLMAGHHEGNHNTPHNRISKFSSQRISRADAAKAGLPVFPYRRS